MIADSRKAGKCLVFLGFRKRPNNDDGRHDQDLKFYH